ncbi:MAG: hypothetical protein HKN14_13035 [Marinicaulis sp.]|nr:hypothetical protein [Marinicaulis sp.]NNL90317.1 hypothetical protein [Marinicaulis sp.]
MTVPTETAPLTSAMLATHHEHSENVIAGNKNSATSALGLTNAQKAALIIAALGPESAGPIIEQIDDSHLRAFARAYAHFQTVPKSTLKAVIDDFILNLSKGDSGDEIRGGVDETKELLSQFIDPENISQLMDGIEVAGRGNIWEKIARAPDAKFAEYLMNQNSQVIAIVLSKLDVEQSSRIIDLFETDLATEVIMRLSRPISVSNDVLNVLSHAIERDFLAPLRKTSSRNNPGQMIGAMMNNVESAKREKLLMFMKENVPEIMNDVKKSMLTFQDLATRVPEKAIPAAIRAVDENIFLRAAKYGEENAPECVEFIFANISKRMAQQYKEQMEDLKQVSTKESEVAQAAFMSSIRNLVAAGELELKDISEETADTQTNESEDNSE